MEYAVDGFQTFDGQTSEANDIEAIDMHPEELMQKTRSNADRYL